MGVYSRKPQKTGLFTLPGALFRSGAALKRIRYTYIAVYLNTGSVRTGATITITKVGTMRTQWRIKTRFLECGLVSLPPIDCLQYLTGITNHIESFNSRASPPVMIGRLNYAICMRQEKGINKGFDAHKAFQ